MSGTSILTFAYTSARFLADKNDGEYRTAKVSKLEFSIVAPPSNNFELPTPARGGPE